MTTRRRQVAGALDEHHERLVVTACLSVVYAPMFLIYLTGPYSLLGGTTDRTRFLGAWVLAAHP